MTARVFVVTPVDIALLAALDRDGSVVGAARAVGISRDRAVYRLERLRERTGAAVVTTRRGGANGGRSGLTARGRAVLEGGAEAAAWPERDRPPKHQSLTGVYRSDPEPRLFAPDGFSAAVAFVAPEGQRATVTLDPESIVVAIGSVRSSARNAWPGIVESVRTPAGEGPSGRRELAVRVGRHRLTVAVTERSVQALGLRPGRRVTLLAKATALRPVGATRGSRPG
ncbi:MAG: TOBE domain-containing protein [Thermoplasmata archaeon]|nr:TOBE domain-containing protein [Thermoplasmata archaeon]